MTARNLRRKATIDLFRLGWDTEDIAAALGVHATTVWRHLDRERRDREMVRAVCSGGPEVQMARGA